MVRLNAFVLGAAIGCVAGVLAALALAPQSGRQTREFVVDRVGGVVEDARDFNAGVAAYARKQNTGLV